jgi:hypothetical protein
MPKRKKKGEGEMGFRKNPTGIDYCLYLCFLSTDFKLCGRCSSDYSRIFPLLPLGQEEIKTWYLIGSF